MSDRPPPGVRDAGAAHEAMPTTGAAPGTGPGAAPAQDVAPPGDVRPQNFQYVVIRVVPRIEREEFFNAGVVLFCRTRSYLAARARLNTALLTALAPDADAASIEAQLDAYMRIAAGDVSAGPVARLSQSERYHWLSAPSSTVVQTSPGHSGVCDDPEATLAHLFTSMVGHSGAPRQLSWPPKVGEPLPAASNAWYEATKLTGWILAEHGHGSEWERVFRVGPDDATKVAEMLIETAKTAVVASVRDRGVHGVVCGTLGEIVLNQRAARVASSWHYKSQHAFPRLITAYPIL